MITSQQPNVNKEESNMFTSTKEDIKASSKVDVLEDNIVFFQTTKKSLSRIDSRTGLNLSKHLAVSYSQSSEDNGRSIYDVYVSGNDSLGKLQAKFLNSHPKLLVKFLNHDYGFNITQKQLR